LGLEYNSKKTKDIFITNKQKSENFKTVIFWKNKIHFLKNVILSKLIKLDNY
jgi:hypothetical protein